MVADPKIGPYTPGKPASEGGRYKDKKKTEL